MKTLTIKISAKGAAFEGDPEREAIRILQDAINKIKAGKDDCKLFDINGNSCGTLKITGK